MRRLIQTIDRAIDYLLLCLFILLLLLGVWLCYDLWYVSGHANSDELLAFKPRANVVRLGDLGEDAVAWITIKDTKIDYPVMQGEDNMEYLNKDPFGEYAMTGSIFLDSRNDRSFHDQYSLLYGHHMEYEMMFGALDKYMKKGYFEKHRNGTLTTRKEKYKLKIFAAIKTDAKVDLIFEPVGVERDTMIAFLKENAKFFDKPKAGNIVGLSTCADPETTDRWVVFGTIQKTGNVKEK